MDETAGDLSLLEDPCAVELLTSRKPAELAYTWTDGTPRVVPLWFHWTGSEVVMSSPRRAPKLRALERNAVVALSIDSDEWPYRALSIRGTVSVTPVEGVVPEYAAAAERYLGPEAAGPWVKQMRPVPSVRIAVRPTWVNLLDFERRFPSALS